MALTVGRPVGRKSAAPSAVGRWRDMLLGTSADASGSPGGGGRRCAFPPYGPSNSQRHKSDPQRPEEVAGGEGHREKLRPAPSQDRTGTPAQSILTD